MNGDFYKREIIITADGSSSIFLPEFNEHYHSHHGAVQESKHVFLKMGWEEKRWQPRVDILEVGFGTGLNAWLVLSEVRKDPAAPLVHYTSLELYPVELSDVELLNYHDYGSHFDPEERREYFMKLHRAEWNTVQEIWTGFELEKINKSVLDYEPTHLYDLIFFDAFAPRVQPELWTKEIFEKMFSLLNPGGILVTYCSKGEVRRNMIAAGFEVEKVPGPPGKREMLRALRP